MRGSPQLQRSKDVCVVREAPAEVVQLANILIFFGSRGDRGPTEFDHIVRLLGSGEQFQWWGKPFFGMLCSWLFGRASHTNPKLLSLISC